MLNEVRKLAVNKREELKSIGEDLKKINNIIDLLKDDMCFFKISINLAIPILLYLGITEENIKDVYFELINYKNFNNGINVRKGIDI